MRRVFVRQSAARRTGSETSGGGSLLLPYFVKQHARFFSKGARLWPHHQGVKQITIKRYGSVNASCSVISQTISTCRLAAQQFHSGELRGKFFSIPLKAGVRCRQGESLQADPPSTRLVCSGHRAAPFMSCTLGGSISRTKAVRITIASL